MTNARASWNVISTQSVYLYNCPLFEATRVEYLLSDEKTLHNTGNSTPLGTLPRDALNCRLAACWGAALAHGVLTQPFFV